MFASVRNPLDALVSRYLKLKNNHKQAFTDPKRLQTKEVDPAEVEQFRVVQRDDLSFTDYFQKYHQPPYGSLLDLSRDHVDFVIRYESLQNDFPKVLMMLGPEQLREVPVTNRTRGKKSDWTSYYSSLIMDQAKRTCGPFMSRWGYEFPESWGPHEPLWRTELEYLLLSKLRKVYIERIRYQDHPVASAAKKMKAVWSRYR